MHWPEKPDKSARSRPYPLRRVRPSGSLASLFESRSSSTRSDSRTGAKLSESPNGRAPALGAGTCRFESCLADHLSVPTDSGARFLNGTPRFDSERRGECNALMCIW